MISKKTFGTVWQSGLSKKLSNMGIDWKKNNNFGKREFRSKLFYKAVMWSH